MTPDDVFKFVNVRPVQLVTTKSGARYAKYGAGQSPLNKKLVSYSEANARDEAIKVAEDFLNCAKGPDGLAKLLSSSAVIVQTEQAAYEARASVEKIVRMPLLEWLQTAQAKAFKDFIWDRVYAHVVVPALMPEGREQAYADARQFSLLEALAKVIGKDDKTRTTDLVLIGVLIPSDLFSRAGKRPVAEFKTKVLEQIKTKAVEVLNTVEALHSAASELRAKERVFREYAPAAVPLINTRPGNVREVDGVEVSTPASPSESSDVVNPPAQTVATTTVVVPKALAVHHCDIGRKLLSKISLSLLSDRPRLGKVSAARAADELEEEAYRIAKALVAEIPKAAVGSLISDGSMAKIVGLTNLPLSPPFIVRPVLGNPPTPEARGLRPLGIGDLLVVKQKLIRYEANEIAHIENVMKLEKKGRTHERLREVEETKVFEVEEIEENEKNLQSTERFELRKEAEKTVETDTKFDSGVSVSASYGVVSVNAHADFALSNSIQESTKSASTFAREVTEKAVSRIQRGTREQRTRRTLEQFKEVNHHELDNSQGSGHVTGIYRWVDKYYRARLVNYGRRLMFEFILPEPAAFYLAVTKDRPLGGVTVQKPDPPTFLGAPLQPKNLTRNNYDEYVGKYNVTDVINYPEAEIIVSAGLAKSSASSVQIAIAESSKDLVVPPGYQAHSVYGTYSFSGYAHSHMAVAVGGYPWVASLSEDATKQPSIHVFGIEGSIPITFTGGATAVVVNACAVCEPTAASIENWQLKTYEAIWGAYNAALSQYNADVAAVQVQQGVSIEGRNPANNRKIERDELRKASIRMLTDEFSFLRVSGQPLYDYEFRAMADSGTRGYPEFDTSTALLEGRIIQFFEQAFEWNNLVYRFYPYFWARKDRWDDLYTLNDSDPLFTDFLKAGAARVVVPVHPAYGETLLYYYHTGDIWNGGVPPTIDDPLYVSIIDELRSDADLNDSADNVPTCSTRPEPPCIVSEWEVKVPTDLVYLQKGSDLNPAESNEQQDPGQGRRKPSGTFPLASEKVI